MFCIQCEQTIQTPAAKGCSYAQGMCGKTAEVSDLQDVLAYSSVIESDLTVDIG